MLQIFKHCRIAPSYSDSAKNRIMGIRPEPIRGKMTDTICPRPRPFSQEFGRQREQSGVLACIIRLDSFSVCFPLDGARSPTGQIFCPISSSLIRDLWAIFGNLCLPLVHSAFCRGVAQEHKFTFGAVRSLKVRQKLRLARK